MLTNLAATLLLAVLTIGSQMLAAVEMWPVSQADSLDKQYRRQRLTWMRSADSPLALAGLFWLSPGDNTFGSQDSCNVRLRDGSGPLQAGIFHLSGTEVTIKVNSGVSITANGELIRNRKLVADSGGAAPDVLKFGDLRMKVIERGGRMAVRVIDLKNPALLSFTRLDFYPIDARYRVKARFRAFPKVKRLQVALITGQVEELECPGTVEFELLGQKVQLEPVLETTGDSKLFFMFKDATNGKQTYGGGRYLYSDLPREGYVNLNFNQAHNPYCAYNSFSTCQIPPLQNWLKIPIPAGEKIYPKAR